MDYAEHNEGANGAVLTSEFVPDSLSPVLETERLVLRPWLPSDAQDLYELAKDPEVGPAASWPPHRSVEESARIIEDVLSADGTFAVVLKETGRLIGCAGFNFGDAATMELAEGEGELGYWIGRPFWDCGYATEAARRVVQYGFDDLKLVGIWGGFYMNNYRSANVIRKLGFHDRGIVRGVDVPLLGEKRDECLAYLSA